MTTEKQSTPAAATIQLNNRPVTLTFDRHARFRYGRFGGNIAALQIAGQDYFQSVLLIWAALADADRANFADPSQLVELIAEDADTEIFEPVIRAVIQAGWIQPQRAGSAGASGTAPAEPAPAE